MKTTTIKMGKMLQRQNSFSISTSNEKILKQQGHCYFKTR